MRTGARSRASLTSVVRARPTDAIPLRTRAGRYGLLLALVCVLAYWAAVALFSLVLGLAQQRTDFQVYWGAAAALGAHAGANIYDAQVIRQAVAADGTCAVWPNAVYVYPPLLAMLFRPLAALPCATAFRVWTVVNLVLWIACTGLLLAWLRLALGETGALYWRQRLSAWWRGAPDRLLATSLLVVIASAISYPLLISVGQGQINLVVLCGLLAAPLLAERGHPRAAGAVLAVIAVLKVYPVVPLLYYTARGRWRVVAGALAAGAVLLGWMLLTVGVPGLLAMRLAATSTTAFTQSASNEALSQIPVWIAFALGGGRGTATDLAGGALVALVALGFAAGLGLLWRRRHAPQVRAAAPSGLDTRGDLLGYSGAICTMLLVAPLTWSHHLAWLLPVSVCCLGILLTQPFGRPSRRAGWLALLALAYVCTSFPLPLVPDFRGQLAVSDVAAPVVAFAGLLRPLGTLLMWGLSVALLFCAGKHGSLERPRVLTGTRQARSYRADPA